MITEGVGDGPLERILGEGEVAQACHVRPYVRGDGADELVRAEGEGAEGEQVLDHRRDGPLEVIRVEPHVAPRAVRRGGQRPRGVGGAYLEVIRVEPHLRDGHIFGGAREGVFRRVRLARHAEPVVVAGVCPEGEIAGNRPRGVSSGAGGCEVK